MTDKQPDTKALLEWSAWQVVSRIQEAWTREEDDPLYAFGTHEDQMALVALVEVLPKDSATRYAAHRMPGDTLEDLRERLAQSKRQIEPLPSIEGAHGGQKAEV